jgi:hypothetical protein
MSKAAKTEVAIRRRARMGMAVFLVALVNLTLQPCVMAAQDLMAAGQDVVSEHCIEHGHQVAQQEYQPADNCALDSDFLTDVRSPGSDNKKSDEVFQPACFIGHDLQIRSIYLSPPADHFDSRASYAGEPSIPDLFCRYLKYKPRRTSPNPDLFFEVFYVYWK